jgi:hypothetical protein
MCEAKSEDSNLLLEISLQLELSISMQQMNGEFWTCNKPMHFI